MKQFFKEPNDPSWQIVGIVVAAIGVIINILAIPDATRIAVGSIISFVGLLICISIIRRPKPTRSIPPNRSENAPPKTESYRTYTTRSFNDTATNGNAIAYSGLRRSLTINFILLSIFGILLSLLPTSTVIWGLAVFFLGLGMLIILIDIVRRAGLLLYRRAVRGTILLASSFGAIVLSVTVVILASNSTGVSITFSFLFVEAILFFIVILILMVTRAIQSRRRRQQRY